MISWHRKTRVFISQRQLADQLGCSKAAVCNWENGKRFPDLQYRSLLMELLAFSHDEEVAFFQAAADLGLL